MEFRQILDSIKSSSKDFIRSPLIILPGALLWIALFCLQKGSLTLNTFLSNNSLNNTTNTTFAFLLVSLVALFIMAFFFTISINLSSFIIQKKKVKRSPFDYTKSLFSSYIITILIVIASMAVERISFYIALYLGKALELEINIATLLLIILNFIGLIGVLIFLTFSIFFSVCLNSGIVSSLKHSIYFVRKNYPQTLLIVVILFLIFVGLGKINQTLATILEYGIIIPFISLFFSRIVLNFGKKQKSKK